MTNIGVIGVGGWGKNHLRVLNELNCLKAICDTNSDNLNEYSSRYKIPGYTNIDEMIKNEKLDGVIICTPTSTHFEIASKIVKLKIPVFVEKPLASSSIEAEKLVKLVKENNTILMVGYIERFNSAVVYLKQLIKNGELGEPILLEFHRENRWSGNVKDVGIVHDTSVHDIDTARWLFSSEPKSIFSRIGSVSKSHDDFVMIMLGFKEDKTAFITSNWITPKKTRELSAIFSNGIVKLDFITQELIIANNEGTNRPRINKSEPLVLELKNFIECIEGKSKPLITGKDALNTNRIADAVVSSSNTGSPIYLEL